VDTLYFIKKWIFFIFIFYIINDINLNDIAVTKQIEDNPPEKLINNLDLDVILILFYKVNLALY
jgi:hypothetical protein